MTDHDIIKAVANSYGVMQRDILGPSRVPSIVFPRQVAVYLCRELLHYSYPQLGRLFKRDHSTALNACRTVANRIEANGAVRLRVAELRAQLAGIDPPEEPKCIGCMARERRLAELGAMLTSAAEVAKGAA